MIKDKIGHHFTLLICAILLPIVILGNKTSTLKSKFYLFEENKGQIRDMNGNLVSDVFFKTTFSNKNGRLDVYITKSGITYCSSSPLTEEILTDREEYEIIWERIDVELLGAKINLSQVIKNNPSNSKKHYYKGSNPEGIRDVHSYKKIMFKDVYPGIDWVLYNKGTEGLKYDFIVAPGADPSMIELIYKSRLPITIADDGSLIMETDQGKIKEQTPISYQGKKIVPTSFKKSTTHTKSTLGHLTNIKFALKNYDRTKLLTIDPALQWSTLLGGNQSDHFFAAESDQQNNLFLVGSTLSSNFPIQNNGTYFRDTINSSQDGVIMKFSDGGALLWSTYIGGTSFGSYDAFWNLEIDAQGNIVASGSATSTDFPIRNAAQPTKLGLTDAIVAKFNNDGELLWSTFWGGDGFESAQSITTDPMGNIYVSGFTSSSNFPGISTSSFQDSYGGGNDVFLVKFTPNGNIDWATYYGSDQIEHSSRLTYGAGNLFLSGHTESTNILMNNGFQPSFGGGMNDVFVAKFNLNGNRIWDSYLGGDEDESPISVEVDNTGNLYLLGATSSTNFPTLNAIAPNPLGGGSDIFLTKIDTDGDVLWSTYYGGDRWEMMNDNFSDNLAIDACGKIYVNFRTFSDNLIADSTCSYDYFDPSYNNLGHSDFISRFSPDGTVEWSTYFGGAHSDHAAIELDTRGFLYLVGGLGGGPPSTAVHPLMPMSGAYYDTLPDGFSQDLFIARFGTTMSYDSSFATNPSCYTLCDGSLEITINGACPPYLYEFEGQTMTDTTGIIRIDNLCSGSYSVIITPSCAEPDTINFTLTSGLGYEGEEDIILCEGDSVYLLGAYQTTGGTYIDTVSCDSIITYNVTVQSYSDATIVTPSNSYCYKDSVIQLSVLNTGGLWSGNGIINEEAGSFSILDAEIADNELVYAIDEACGDADTIIFTVLEIPKLNMTIRTLDCENSRGSILTEIIGETIPPYNYNWNTGDTSPFIDNLNSGTYQINVTDNNGCSTDTIIVLLPRENRCGEIYVHIPNSFTPNENGKNDIFLPVFNDMNVLSYTLKIFDRWGGKLFETDNITTGWDGTYRGKELPVGLYNYLYEYSYEDEKIIKYKKGRGVINLLR